MHLGAQITHDYQPACVHRADISFSIYGFVARANPPILCAIDLPHFNSSLMFQPTELTDEEFGARQRGSAEPLMRRGLSSCSHAEAQLVSPNSLPCRSGWPSRHQAGDCPRALYLGSAAHQPGV